MRSKLFVPAIRFDLFEKALATDADAICFDLEDAVSFDRKAAAREVLSPFLQQCMEGSHRLLVRTNSVTSSDFALDLDACVGPSVFAITLPKVESSEDIQFAERSLLSLESERTNGHQLKILPTIESPRGLRNALEIANASSRIVGLQIGFADLLEPLGISSDNTFARNQVRWTLRLAAAEANLDCYDSAFPDYKDLAAFQRHLDAAYSFGFAGCSCIHPSQVELANSTFTPSAEALSYANRIVGAAYEAEKHGIAVGTLDGKMIDRPFITAAERLLARSRSIHSNHAGSRSSLG
jgi:citrate lyase subunit beta/citryl-CoA lyase